MDVMGHLAIHSFSSHATYLDAQQLAALMWSGGNYEDIIYHKNKNEGKHRPYFISD